jgi:hypothetical protein
MPMNFEQFAATGRDMTNAAGEVTARTYLEVLFIEQWIDGRAGIAPPNGEPTWLLTTDGPEQETGDIATLELKLYAWAMANGYCDDEDAAADDTSALQFIVDGVTLLDAVADAGDEGEGRGYVALADGRMIRVTAQFI